MNTIKIFTRAHIGKKHNKILRINNKFPAIIYGNNISNICIYIYNKDILNIKLIDFMFSKNKCIYLIGYNNNTITAKILNIQYHPYKNKIYHIDFLYITGLITN
ncbi:50S ribosomal protein L25 [Enterobacteriaceae endosymbiont of Macroplea mutica]|uniref:50S ribosomal protein L25 n=1 Tax=Enterobacteriaceae endosymbiont of Macroplea mutica TaxID=2675791 RepID=UPI0014496803|nr:50S ribosomal protein L25 [Enterobacteriaceae endosymbiont of Macroplea mutica]QJC31100.1 50S ribosomal protein L25 [Enterobacteriaceae endosymbiont of Macroplea mutica]